MTASWFQRLTARFRSPDTLPATEPGQLRTNPDITSDATDPAANPAVGYPHHFHPTEHHLSTGEPNRGDELIWVETEIARHADAGTLDEGNPFILDAEITHREHQWHAAITDHARRRQRNATGLAAAQSHYLITALHHIATIRADLAQTTTENQHWRSILHGAPITTPTTITAPTHAPLTDTVRLAEAPVPTAIHLEATTQPPGHPVLNPDILTELQLHHTRTRPAHETSHAHPEPPGIEGAAPAELTGPELSAAASNAGSRTDDV